ncbi:MAG: hypothetical protein ABIN80_12315 [Dyadobacter sp.]|uniref:hypothetical protein n=1 Tax=Dyadobacter sp. TaxID=1914288 RepID=UPI003264D1A4
MKASSASKTSAKGGTYNQNLDKLENVDLFPAKTAIAKATLLKAVLPSKERAILSSSLKK